MRGRQPDPQAVVAVLSVWHQLGRDSGLECCMEPPLKLRVPPIGGIIFIPRKIEGRIYMDEEDSQDHGGGKISDSFSFLEILFILPIHVEIFIP